MKVIWNLLSGKEKRLINLNQFEWMSFTEWNVHNVNECNLFINRSKKHVNLNTAIVFFWFPSSTTPSNRSLFSFGFRFAFIFSKKRKFKKIAVYLTLPLFLLSFFFHKTQITTKKWTHIIKCTQFFSCSVPESIANISECDELDYGKYFCQMEYLLIHDRLTTKNIFFKNIKHKTTSAKKKEKKIKRIVNPV